MTDILTSGNGCGKTDLVLAAHLHRIYVRVHNIACDWGFWSRLRYFLSGPRHIKEKWDVLRRKKYEIYKFDKGP
jgi:hypothetical protein